MDTLPGDPNNRLMLPHDLYGLSLAVYKPANRGEGPVQAWAHSHNLRVKEDKLLSKDVRMVVATNEHLGGGSITVVVGLRGTDTDSADNLKQDLSLLFHKLLDKQGDLKQAHEVVEYLGKHLPRIREAAERNSSSSSSIDDSSVQVYITGHSLGGVVAEVATVRCVLGNITAGTRLHCLSFESTGLPKHIYKEALEKHNRAYWEQILTGYLSCPNPINMHFEHLGTIIHVVIPWDNTTGHMVKCTAATLARVAAVAGVAAAGVAITAAAGGAAATAAAGGAAASATAGATAAAAVAEGAAAAAAGAAAAGAAAAGGAAVAATGISAAGAAGWALAGAIATGLGVSAKEVLSQHKLENMEQCFHSSTRELKPECCCVMHTWPHVVRSDTVSDLAGAAVRAALPSFINRENHGLATMFDRTGMLHARCRNIPGYVTAQDHADSIATGTTALNIFQGLHRHVGAASDACTDAATVPRTGAGSLSLPDHMAAQEQPQLQLGSKGPAVKASGEAAGVQTSASAGKSAGLKEGGLMGKLAKMRL